MRRQPVGHDCMRCNVSFMVNPKQFAILKASAASWNLWRTENPMERIDLCEARLNGADLRNFNLMEALLREGELAGAHLGGANLTAATLTSADLREAHLERATLVRADLWRADLRGADLRAGDFRNARVREASFGRAMLIDVNLTGADLEGAIFDETVLGNTNLSNALVNGRGKREAIRLTRASRGRQDQAAFNTIVLELYGQGKISSGKAGELLDMPRFTFVRYASQLCIPFFDMTEEEWQAELGRAAQF